MYQSLLGLRHPSLHPWHLYSVHHMPH
ncbi:hypothetical protein E2C01_101468 [Portunus trituberculatus]|uniref:Uncharacterized protein n=1 Tax=Portunus trituberculatus TaxID=210409 RepID=A0A5B7KK53_PORTR|nr:hypothetical protein [Portunus trituberculatus]